METSITALHPKLYIGMDIHKKSWSVHIRTNISDHKTLTLPPKPSVLLEYIEMNFPCHEVSLTYEAGCCGFSASRYFLSKGWKVLVVNPSDVPRSDKQNYQKTDKIDCRNLAKQLQSEQLRGIFIPTEEQDFLKTLLRQRIEATRVLRSTKLRIKSMLLYHSIEIPKEFDNPNWSKAFIGWLEQICWPTPTGKLCIESMLRLYKAAYDEYLKLANELRSYCRKVHKKDYYLLKSITGIGGYLAACILAEVGDLRRFNNEAQFASYIGLVPSIRNSGSTERVTGISPRCRGIVRSYIIEAAWVALRLDPEMQQYYRTHAGKNPKSIIVKIARKLLNRMLSVIKKETPYVTNYQMKIKSDQSAMVVR